MGATAALTSFSENIGNLGEGFHSLASTAEDRDPKRFDGYRARPGNEGT
jgi:hypothetical protein